MRSRHPQEAAFVAKALVLFALAGELSGCGITQSDYRDYTGSQASGGSGTNGTTDGGSGSATATYSGGVKALLDGHCMGAACHSTGGASADLSTYAGATAKAQESQRRISIDNMPLTPPLLTATEKALFKAWVTAGTPQ